MTIHTDYHGTIEYEANELVTFSEGIFGFPSLKKFLPLCMDEGDSSLLLLQSVEDQQIAFFLINPCSLLPDYDPVLQPEDLTALEVENSGELSYYSICVVRSNYLDNTVNLKCPLAINPVTRQGRQVILNGNNYGYRHPLSTLLNQPENMNGGNCNADSQT